MNKQDSDRFWAIIEAGAKKVDFWSPAERASVCLFRVEQKKREFF